MDIVHGKELHYEELGLKHRGSGLAFKHLFLGEENTPENYLFSIARQGAFYSPIYRHTFDQFWGRANASLQLGTVYLITTSWTLRLFSGTKTSDSLVRNDKSRRPWSTAGPRIRGIPLNFELPRSPVLPMD
ncbi:hypothetical protein N7467_011700 [Penicillium canescens]|nr:hypothetical protein N7467_011700 [Penicillium canescens]